MAILVGDKSILAIEACIDKRALSPFGNVRVWLNGGYVGSYEDPVSILVFISGIRRVFNLNVDANKEFSLSSESFFNGVMDGAMSGGDRYRLSLGESFDDFSIVGFRDDDFIHIIWILNDGPFFHYPAYPAGIQSSRIPVDIFKSVTDRFESDVMNK